MQVKVYLANMVEILLIFKTLPSINADNIQSEI